MTATYGHVTAAAAEALDRLEKWTGGAKWRGVTVSWESVTPHRVTARIEAVGCPDMAAAQEVADFIAAHIDVGVADADTAAYFPEWETTGHGADIHGPTAWVTLRADSADARAAADADRAEADYCYAAGAANDRAERRYMNEEAV